MQSAGGWSAKKYELTSNWGLVVADLLVLILLLADGETVEAVQ